MFLDPERSKEAIGITVFFLSQGNFPNLQMETYFLVALKISLVHNTTIY